MESKTDSRSEVKQRSRYQGFFYQTVSKVLFHGFSANFVCARMELGGAENLFPCAGSQQDQGLENMKKMLIFVVCLDLF